MQKGAAYWMDLHHFDDEDPIFLAQVQRGITNFVKILTGKNIPVEYAVSGDSMTDGEMVYISSKINQNTIDYTVGLALHEASHVLLTDFGYLNKEKGKVLEYEYKIPEEDIDDVFTLVNFVEDKRIDNFVYSTAPGYQFYYEELYRKSFFNEIVDKNLQNDTFIKPTWDAYFFRIINIFNRNSELDALPGLKEVGDLLAFDRINMLQSTRDSVQLAVKIYNIIKPHIVEEKEESNDNKNSQENKTREHVDRQKNFINSQYRKKRVHKNVKNQINKLADDSTKIKNYKINKNSSLPIIITDKWKDYFSSHFNHCDSAVDKGFSLGKKLLKKLKVRNNIKKDIFENQKKGKLNSKKLFQATYNENLFYRVEKEDFKNVFLHISLDLSGSMRGEKLEKTIQTSVAIAYAACHLKNFDVEISLRGTIEKNKNKTDHTPLLAYAFNSKKHSVKSLKDFKNINICGMTPEGICLDEIRKTLPKNTHSQEVYLLNISDGLPNISSVSYNFSTAVNHASQVVKEYKKDNIKVLSYFIHDVWDKGKKSKDTFGKIYGKNARYIDVNDISLVADSINSLLLSNTIKVF